MKNNQSNKKYVPKNQGGYIPPSNTNKKKSKFTLSQWIVFILMIFWTVCSCLSIYLSIRDLTTVSASTEDNKKVASTYADSITTFNFVTVPIQMPVYVGYHMYANSNTSGGAPNFTADQYCYCNLYPTYYTFNLLCTNEGAVNEERSTVSFYDSATNWTSKLTKYGESDGIFQGYWNVMYPKRTVFMGFSGEQILPYDTSSYAQFIHLSQTGQNVWFNYYDRLTEGGKIYINIDSNYIIYNTVPDNVTITLDRLDTQTVRVYYIYRNSTIDTDNSTYFFRIYTDYKDMLTEEFSYTRFIDTTSLENGQYMLGFDQGYNLGLAEGDNTGYQNGYDRGYTDGKNVGYNQGVLESNDYSFLGLLGAVVDAPISVVSQWLNFDLLGFNMSNFFFAICTLALTIAIIRLIL